MTDLERVELAARRAMEAIMRQPQMDIARAFQIFANECAKARHAATDVSADDGGK
jgi:hypothetical protein